MKTPFNPMIVFALVPLILCAIGFLAIAIESCGWIIIPIILLMLWGWWGGDYLLRLAFREDNNYD